jgi:hypothetical protein
VDKIGPSAGKIHNFVNFFLHHAAMSVFINSDALARAYGPSWLCNDVTRPFWQSRSGQTGPEREVDMVAFQSRAPKPSHVAGTGAQNGAPSRSSASLSALN